MSVTTPRLIGIPFASGASGAYRNLVPIASQIGITDGAASYTDGFVPKNMTNIAGGGVAPFGQDFNGVLYDLSCHMTYSQAGMIYTYDPTFSTAIGGYPAGAIVRMADNSGVWINTSGSTNSNDPASGSGWTPMFGYGSTSKTLSNANVTLTNAEASKGIIVLSGTLTANVAVIVPTWIKQWLVVNTCTGAFTVTVKTSGGTGATIPSAGSNAPTPVYGDGTNVYVGSTATWASITGKPTTIGGYNITDVNSYAPTLTGAGASGNWPINITGTSNNITAYTINQNLGTGNVVTHAGATFNGGVTIASGDFKTYRSGGTTGVVLLDSAGNHYVYFDGTNYNMPSGNLVVNGYTVLNASNYNSYAPTLTGGGATGNWSINITGNAATASNATNAGYATNAGSSDDSIGNSQSWQDLTGGRTTGVDYTNTTSRPIMVNVTSGISNGGENALVVDSGEVARHRSDNPSYNSTATLSAIVPVGSTYRFDVSGTGYIYRWAELQ